MSADNFVGVMQNKITGKWHVWDGCASCDYESPPEPCAESPDWCRVFDTKEQAMDEAMRRDADDYYEYGFQILPEDAGFKPPPYHVMDAIDEVARKHQKPE